MLANADPKLNTAPIQRPVSELSSLCGMHDVAHGEPDNLADFMRALEENKLFAMNFWSRVARLTDSKGGAAGPDWLRAAIVESVTGQTISEVGAASSKNTLLLVRLSRILAGEDVHCPDVEKPFAPVRELNAVPTHNTRATVEAVESPREASRLNSITPDSNLCGVSDGTPRLLLKAKLSSLRPHSHDEDAGESEIPIPLASYAEANPIIRRVSPTAVSTGLLLAMLIAYGGWIAHHRRDSEWGRLRASIRAGFASAIDTWNANGVRHANSTVHAANTNGPGAFEQKPAIVAVSWQSITPPQGALIASSKPSTPQAHKSNSIVAQAPHDTASIVRSRVPEGDASEASAASASETDGNIVIPEAVMQANLTSSRVPVYPEAARANHLEGLVVIQAVVSKQGTVGHLHVLRGDPALRRAAMEAASTWRYRPYLSNGRPVDVSTTISVDFSETE